MSPFNSACRNRIPPEDFEIWIRISRVGFHFTHLLAEVKRNQSSNFQSSRYLTSWCHLVVRALHEAMADERLQIIDGFYRMVCDLGDRFGMGKTEHTWLQTRQGSVIDISPVGVIGGPLIFAHRDPDIGGDYHFASHQFQPGGIEDVIARILVSQSYSDSYKPVRDLFVEAIRLATADLG